MVASYDCGLQIGSISFAEGIDGSGYIGASKVNPTQKQDKKILRIQLKFFCKFGRLAGLEQLLKSPEIQA